MECAFGVHRTNFAHTVIHFTDGDTESPMRCLVCFSTAVPPRTDLPDETPICLLFDGLSSGSRLPSYCSNTLSPFLQHVCIPSEVTEIGAKAFFRCPKLASVSFAINSTLRVIGSQAFEADAWDLSPINSIALPASVEEIGESCFRHCLNLLNFDIPADSHLRRLCKDSVGGTRLVGQHGWSYQTRPSFGTLYVPDSMEELGDDTLQHVVTPMRFAYGESPKLRRFGTRAFAYDKGEIGTIRSITIPDTIEEIDRECFQYAICLQAVHFGANTRVKVLGFQAFAWSGLVKFTVPKTVEVIDNFCFYNCESLLYLWFEADSHLQTIGRSAFAVTKLVSLEVPGSVERICEYAFRELWQMTKLEFDMNARLKVIGKYAFECARIREIVLPDSVEEIGDFAFEGCYLVNTVRINPTSHLRILGETALSGLRYVESIDIPDSVEVIGQNCFENCKVLKTVRFGDGSRLREVGTGVFESTQVDVRQLNIPTKLQKAMLPLEKKKSKCEVS